jgi:hypothetical protein
LGWAGFPSTGKEFQDLQSFKTHKLDILLRLSGAETKIKVKFLSDWSVVATWDPEARYQPIGTATRQEARSMIDSTKSILRQL